jgi:DNA-binding NarL/FixJ family response regulator
MAPIKVLSASADASFQASLRAAICDDEGIALSASIAEDTEHLQANVVAVGPDVILLDESYFPATGLLARMRTAFAPARVIVVVDECGPVRLAELIRCGARGCIQKDVSAGLWRKAMHAVHDGDIWVNRNVVLALLEALATADPDAKPPDAAIPDGRLTEREWEVARLVARGMTNKEVGRFMAISDMTVKTHLKHIFNKLHVTRRAHIPHLAGDGWPNTLHPGSDA